MVEEQLAPDTAQEPQVTDDLDVKSHRQSIEDTLRAEMDAAEQRTAEAKDASEKPKKKEPAKDIKAEGEKQRDQAGKFVAADGAKEKPAAEAQPDSSKTKEAESPKAVAATPAITADPPNSWSKEAKAIWSTLPAAIQAEAHKRERDMANGVEQLKQHYADIDTVMAPRRQLLQQAGRTAGQAIGQMWEWHDRLSHPDPAQRYSAVVQLARDYGINMQQAPQQFAQPQGIPQYGQDLQPLLAPAYAQLDTLGRSLQQLQEEKLQNEISSFADGKDAQGNPTHPHFDMAKPYMAKVLSNGMAANLDEAYRLALRNDDGLIAAIAAEKEAKEAEAKAKAEADAKAKADEEQRKKTELAAKARKAAVSPRPTAPTGVSQPSSKKGKSVDEALREAWKEYEETRV